MAETEKFFDAVAMVKKGTFQDLFLSPVAFVNAATAPLYGLARLRVHARLQGDDAGREPAARLLDPRRLPERLRFYNRTSPIHRGAFIMKQVLGTPIGTPPPGAEATALPPASADLNTNRKQVDAQTAGGVCESCHHAFINPAGLRDGGLQRRRHLADEGAVDRRAHRHRRRTWSIDGVTMHVTGPLGPDDEDRRLGDGAAPLRGALDLVRCSSARATARLRARSTISPTRSRPAATRCST